MPERPTPDEIRRRVLEDRPFQDYPEEPPSEPVTPRPSATVILARDGAHGVEVFMLERHLESGFLGGAYVFPGGTVDDRDCDPALLDATDGLPLDLPVLFDAPPERAHGYTICAIRETFEEAGVLLARDGKSRFLAPAGEERFVEARRALTAGRMTPLELARREGIRFAADALGYYARWITPEYAPRRYDVRFFIARMPENQAPIHDDIETTASVWVRPEDALARAREGTLMIIFPTRKMLESLARYRSTDQLLAVRRTAPPPVILPRLVMREDGPRVVLPDGSEHLP
jgi:8-oxo-dGTP pyrophosphatase MutT (NUDIX family)